MNVMRLNEFTKCQRIEGIRANVYMQNCMLHFEYEDIYAFEIVFVWPTLGREKHKKQHDHDDIINSHNNNDFGFYCLAFKYLVFCNI